MPHPALAAVQFAAPGPPPANRLPADPQVDTRAQLDQIVAEAAWLEAVDQTIDGLLATLKQDLDELAAAAKREISGHADGTAGRRKLLDAAAEKYVAAHKAELLTGGAKSIDVLTGTLGYRKQQDRLAYLEGLDKAEALKRLYDQPSNLLGELQTFLKRLELQGPGPAVEVSKCTSRKLVVYLPEADARFCEAVLIERGNNAGTYQVATYEVVDFGRTCLELVEGERLPCPSDPPPTVRPILSVPAAQILELTPAISLTKAKAARKLGTLTDPQLHAVGLEYTAGADQFFLKP